MVWIYLLAIGFLIQCFLSSATMSMALIILIFNTFWTKSERNVKILWPRELQATGQGFDLPGRRLGGFSGQPPLSSLRPNALAAAENRAQHEALLPSEPMRPSGDSSIKAALSLVQAAAMAAERRLQDTGGSSESAKSFLVHDGGYTRSSNPGLKDLQAMWQCSSCTLLNHVNFQYFSFFLLQYQQVCTLLIVNETSQ